MYSCWKLQVKNIVKKYTRVASSFHFPRLRRFYKYWLDLSSLLNCYFSLSLIVFFVLFHFFFLIHAGVSGWIKFKIQPFCNETFFFHHFIVLFQDESQQKSWVHNILLPKIVNTRLFICTVSVSVHVYQVSHNLSLKKNGSIGGNLYKHARAPIWLLIFFLG